jgi:hypothetical protein
MLKKDVFVSCGRRLGVGEVQAYVTDQYVEASITMDLFVELLKIRIGPVATTIRQKTFEQKVDDAVASILLDIKKGARPLSAYVK